jgi:hypothetical protein
MGLYEEMAADLPKIILEIGRDVVIDGSTVKATVSETQIMETLSDGGFQQSAQIEFKCLVASLPSIPAIGKKITFNGIVYRINAIGHRPPYPIISLVCQHEHQ